jgi:GntR family transcriptional regulator, transcriptional repressor for pyruvate dehydrogenase complex
LSAQELSDPLFTAIQPTRDARLYELVAGRIEGLILSGQLPSGYCLPSEAELGQRFSVSRTAVREAIKVLTDKGLVRPQPGRGTFVCRPDPELLAASMNTILRVERCTLSDLLELRRLVEVPLAGLAAQRATPEHKVALKSALEALEGDGGSHTRFMLADKAFHVTIARASGNELSAALVDALMSLSWKRQLFPLVVYENAMPFHYAIADAILAGDDAAAIEKMAAYHGQIRADLTAAGALAASNGSRDHKANMVKAVS